MDEVLRLLFGQLLFPTFQWLKNCGTHFPNHFLYHPEQPDSEIKIAEQNSYISSGESRLVWSKQSIMQTKFAR